MNLENIFLLLYFEYVSVTSTGVYFFFFLKFWVEIIAEVPSAQGFKRKI